VNGYVTWGEILWLVVGLTIGDVLAHIGKDVFKLYQQRRKGN